jgi:site-specific DNA-methyltransferase (adenine-specific)
MPVKVAKEETHPDLLTLPPRGVVHQVQEDGAVQLHYEAARGKLFCGDSLAWLSTVTPASIDLCFADPPYNIKKADWDTFQSHSIYVDWSRQWIELAARALKPTGSLYICGFSEILADLKVAAMPFFRSCRWLVWHYKNKANLGNDWGRSHESILHLRKSSEFTMNIGDVRIPYGAHTLKYPQHPQALTSQFGQGKEREADWTPNPAGAKPKDVFDIPTTCNGMGEKTAHPTQKPEELLRKIVLASSNPGDLVADPFSGSGTTCVVAEQLGRRWLGCDANPTYNQWAIERINAVPQKPVAVWMELDRKTASRRESIR